MLIYNYPGAIEIAGPDGLSVSIFAVDGKHVANGQTNEKILLPSKGLYIATAEGHSFKLVR